MQECADVIAGIEARAPRAVWGAFLVVFFSCTNTSNNAAPGAVLDAGTDAGRLATPYLWSAGGALSAFTRTQTVSSNDDEPAFMVVPDRPTHNCHDLAFDGHGNLWTIPIDGDQILRIPAARLSAQAPAVPDLVITSPALKSPQSLVFDSTGNLWVLNFDGAGPSIATIVRFDDPRGLAGDQTSTPSLTITPGTTAEEIRRFTQGIAIAFDGAGSLWFAGVSNALRLEGVSSSQGEIEARVAAVVATGEAYASLAFDAAGALWITAAQDGDFFALRFSDPAALQGAVSPVPAARVRLMIPMATFAGGMGFDAEGGLWIATNKQLVKLAHAAGLSGEISLAPDVVLGQAAFPDLASKVVVRPTPAGLPLFAP